MRHRNVPNTTRPILEHRQPNSRGFYGFGLVIDGAGNPQVNLTPFTQTVESSDPIASPGAVTFLDPHRTNVSLFETNPSLNVDPTLQNLAPVAAAPSPSKNVLFLGIGAAVVAALFLFRKK